MARTETDKERVCVGVIVGAHGVRGEVKVKSFTEDPLDVAAYGPVETEDGRARFALEVRGEAKGSLIVRLKGVGDRNAAEALRGTQLYVARDRLPEADPESWYQADLIGLAAVSASGARVGRVIAVHNFGAGDLLEIAPDGAPSFFLPFTAETVPDVAVAEGRITVDLPAGLLDEDGEGPEEAP